MNERDIAYAAQTAAQDPARKSGVLLGAGLQAAESYPADFEKREAERRAREDALQAMQVRHSALDQAIKCGGETGQIIDRARAFEKFLKGE